MAKLKSADLDLLDAFSQRCQAVADYLHIVITNIHTYGFYLWGARGVGKSTGIALALKKLKVSPVRYSGTMTPASLYQEAQDNPDGVLWINDDPNLMKQPEAQQYLLAMLESSGKDGRLVTRARVRAKGEDRFIFNGKIIFDSNVSITNSKGKSTLLAVQDRMPSYHFAPTNSELAAVTRQAAINPFNKQFPFVRISDEDKVYWKETTEKERVAIAEFIIESSHNYQTPISLRMLKNGLKYFVMARDYNYKTDWQDYIIQQMTTLNLPITSRKDERLNEERQALIEIVEGHEEKEYLISVNSLNKMNKKKMEYLTCENSTNKMDIKKDIKTYQKDIGTYPDTWEQPLKSDVIDRWCERTGQKPAQFRRRLAECPENIRQFYDKLADKRSKK